MSQSSECVLGIWRVQCAGDADRPAGFPLTCDQITQRIRQVLANRAVNLGNKSHDTLRRACRANLHTVPDCVACDYTPSGKRRRKQQSRKLLPGHVRSESGLLSQHSAHTARAINLAVWHLLSCVIVSTPTDLY